MSDSGATTNSTGNGHWRTFSESFRAASRSVPSWVTWAGLVTGAVFSLGGVTLTRDLPAAVILVYMIFTIVTSVSYFTDRIGDWKTKLMPVTGFILSAVFLIPFADGADIAGWLYVTLSFCAVAFCVLTAPIFLAMYDHSPAKITDPALRAYCARVGIPEPIAYPK